MDTFMTSYADPAPVSAERLDAAGYSSALAEAQQRIGTDPLPPLDAIIHGVCVRLHTNSAHWQQFWSANWFAPSQWATLTGSAAPDEPQIHVYAIAGEERKTPWAGYSLAHGTAFFTGDGPYGPLRSLALGAAANWLAGEEAAHFVPGACINEGGRWSVLLNASQVPLPMAVAQLMRGDDTHLLAVKGVFIRYGLVRMVDGVTMLPTQLIDEQGFTTRGYRLFPWLDEYGFEEPRADVRCLTLEGKEEYCFARDLDLGRAPDAMAFPLEQAWYVPTQIVAADPGLVGALWPRPDSDNRALLENVPPFAPDLLHRFGQWASQAVSALSDATNPSTRLLLEGIGEEKVAEALCRLRAAPEARALVSPEQLWPGRAGGNPWRPLRVEKVTLLGGAEPAPLVASALSEQLAKTGAYLSDLYEDRANDILTRVLGRAMNATG